MYFTGKIVVGIFSLNPQNEKIKNLSIPRENVAEPGQEFTTKIRISHYKSANFETDGLPVIYDNKFTSDVIGSRMVSTILKFKSPSLKLTRAK